MVPEFANLPSESAECVASFMTVKELGRLSQVSQHANRAANRESLWATIYALLPHYLETNLYGDRSPQPPSDAQDKWRKWVQNPAAHVAGTFKKECKSKIIGLKRDLDAEKERQERRRRLLADMERQQRQQPRPPG